MEREYKVVELFSGIGSQAKALQNIGMKINVQGTCEWDYHAFVAYDAIHNSPELTPEVEAMTKSEVLKKLEGYTISSDGKTAMTFPILKTYTEDSLKRMYQAIIRSHNYVDITSLTGNKLPKNIDILTYSFPCQDLSNVGAFHGYNKGIDKDSGSRSSLLWQVGRILREMEDSNRRLPKYLLMENVPTLLSKRHYGNFSMWKDDLEKLGYVNIHYEVNAHDFGLPQNRPRLLMLSVFVGKNNKKRKKINKYFSAKQNSGDIIEDYKKSGFYQDIQMRDLFRIDYSDKTFLDEAIECTPNDTPSRQKIWEDNPQLVLKGNKINPEFNMIRTITTKQDRNPNSGNLYIDTGIAGKSRFRYLTPRECLLFMGFEDNDYENIKKYNTEIHKGSDMFPRDKIIRMAGNSIPVKLLEGIFLQIKIIEEQVLGNGRSQ